MNRRDILRAGIAATIAARVAPTVGAGPAVQGAHIAALNAISIAVGGLVGGYTIKVDANGYVRGFGLAEVSV